MKFAFSGKTIFVLLGRGEFFMKTKATITMITFLVANALVVLSAVGPAGARLDERILEGVPYITPPPTVALVQTTQNIYKVQSGDTLSSISAKQGVSIQVLATANGLSNLDRIREGQKLQIPNGNDNVTHLIQPGDTLSSIAKTYKVDTNTLASRNGLGNRDRIVAGQKLLIPSLEAIPAISSQFGSFAWPLLGALTSPFGLRDGRSHEGIDIAAEANTPIRAVATGKVVFADSRGTYGMTVIIDHGNDMRTLYAHCAKLFVSVGDLVDTSTVIALAGSTGRSTGPHLHLEVLRNGVPLDPLYFLPQRDPL